MADTANGYKPISDYGAIGNLRTVALVGLDGSVDWCCFPHMSSASIFAAILDHQRGGRFRVRPAGVERGSQEYIEDTNVLATAFDAEGGRLTVTDMLPLRGDIDGMGDSEAPPELHRILRCEGSAVEVEVEWSPRFDYARQAARIHRVEGGWVADAATGERVALGGVGEGKVVDDGFGPVLRASFTLEAGKHHVLVTRWDSTETGANVEQSMRLFQETVETWRGWVHKEGKVGAREWAGVWLPQVVRSELALKLVTHADTGAIAAAPTTSLPEHIGGVRNWDYRFTWIRDASLTAQALIALGHEKEAIEFLLWAEHVSEARSEEDHGIQIMYGLHGEPDLDEEELSHLEGYRGSRPVRIGNGAAKQLQLDIYGELLDSAYELARRGVVLEPSLQGFLRAVADRACKMWSQPDYGIWEVRSGAQHFVHSKLMSWVALDRAVHLADRYGLEGDVEQWRRSRAQVFQSVIENGYDPEVGAFVQYYGSKALDASSLRIPLLEMLPFDDPRVQSTIDRTLEDLTENGLVYRYHTDQTDDGLPGGEGTFGLCTFWLVDALALSRRIDEAWEIFEGLAGRANHVGLLSEQVDAHTGEFLGNFPQAFTHIGLVNSMLYLAYAEGKEIPEPYPIGTPEHRAEIGHEITQPPTQV